MSKARRLVPVLAAVSLSAGVIILVAGALWMAGSASGERERFSSLQIAPRDADVFVAINTDPTSPQWLAVNDSLDAVNAKDPIRRAVDEALAEVNLDWEEDILPIAGDEGYFSVPDVSEADSERGYVAAFRLRNTAKAEEVFDRLRERAVEQGQEYETDEYEGVTIHSVAKPDLDGDPSTESDCEVDDEGTIICDGQAPIPEDPYFTCLELAVGGVTADEAPAECLPFFECPIYSFDPAAVNEEDLNSNGTPDSCEEADQIKREWEESIEFADPYQDCADAEDVSDPQCEDVTTLVGAGGAVALFEDVLAVGASSDDVKAVIDVVQGRAPSAEENERLQESRLAQNGDFLVWGSADLAPVWDMAESSIPTDSGANGSSDPVETAPPPAPQGGLRIPAFDAEYRIEDGALHVTERITVDFGQIPADGMRRDISTRITYDAIYDVIVTIEPRSVTKDGIPEPFEQPPVGGDYHQIRIGDPNVPITGQHMYELQYVVRGALIKLEDEDGTFYDIVWNVTGGNWGVPIEQASAKLTIPHGSFGWTPCAVGEDPFPAIQEGCSMTQDGITTMRFASKGTIELGSSMAFLANVSGESGAPDAELVPNHRLPFETEETQDAFPFAFDSAELFDEMRGTYDRVGFSISSTGDGFALDLRVMHAPGFEPKFAVEPTKVFDSHFADSVPADTMFFFAGYDLYGQSWVPLRKHLEDVKLPDGTTLDDFLQQFGDETGLDLESDILSLLTGEYAIAGDVSDFNQDAPEFNILAMLDVADAGRAQQSLDELGDYLEGEDAVEINEAEGIQQWTIKGSDAEVVGVTVSGDAVIAGYPDSAVEDAVTGFDPSLSETSDWTRTMGLLPDDTTSIGFISVSRILEEAREMDDAEGAFKEATDGDLTLEDLTPIRSVGYATTTMEDGYGARIVLLITD